jgi:predicted AlkP superfamily phosphohydrolase/phosphomutase
MTGHRVLLIGLDGATFDVLDPLMRAGVMPCLKRVIDRGVRAVLRSTVPALTPPAWTSLVTGRSPGAHGIFDFFRKTAASSPHLGLLTSRDVACRSLWSMASDAGLRSTILNFPLTFPPPQIDGHVVPGGFIPWRHLRLGCHPAGLFDRLRALPRFNARELALDMAEEAKAIEGCAQSEYESWIDMHIRRERQWVDIAQYLAATEPAAFTAVLFDGVDKIQHLCWRFVDPHTAGVVTSDWERRVSAKCREYFSELDRRIEDLLATFGEETSVVIASDHGFGPQVRTFFVNSWLRHKGHLAWQKGESPASVGPTELGLNQLARHVNQIDWTRTRAFAPLPSGNGIHIVRADESHPDGIPADRYQEFRTRLASDLLRVGDPESGEPVVSRVWTREEIFSGPNMTLAPDLTLELRDGGLISILDSPEYVQRRPVPTGTHHPDGVFVTMGPGVRHGIRVDSLSILDVAPVLAYGLTLPIPTSMEGRFPVEIMDATALGNEPPAYVDDASNQAPKIGDVELDTEAEAEILSRLQALGYIE